MSAATNCTFLLGGLTVVFLMVSDGTSVTHWCRSLADLGAMSRLMATEAALGDRDVGLHVASAPFKSDLG